MPKSIYNFRSFHKITQTCGQHFVFFQSMNQHCEDEVENLQKPSTRLKLNFASKHNEKPNLCPILSFQPIKKPCCESSCSLCTFLVCICDVCYLSCEVFWKKNKIAKGSCVMRFKTRTQRSWMGTQNKKNVKL